MKQFINRVALATILVSGAATVHAQTDLQNTGTLYITGSPDILYVSGNFTNVSGSALTNNGNLYVQQTLTNGQAAMPAGTGTLYLNGSAAQSVSGTQIFKTFNLVTNNAAGITLNNDLSVAGVHTFTSGIVTSSVTPNYLVYEAGSSYTGDGDAMHVKGWVQKIGSTAFTFPLGNGTVERTIAASGLAVSSVFNANYAGPTTNTANKLAPLVLIDPNEYWIVNQVSGAAATINMNWNNSKIAMPNYGLASIRVANYIAGNWTQVGTGAAGNVATTGTISSNSISSFGSFTFASTAFLLPVNLLQFNAWRNNGNTIISWTTSDEVNVSQYQAERSDDGILFYAIASVPARNLPGLQIYESTDQKALKGKTYYRLRSTDIDGKTKLSKIVMLDGTNLSNIVLSVVNPVHKSIHVMSGNNAGLYEYRINTVGGQTIQQGKIQLSSGTADILLSGAVSRGLYVLQIDKPGSSFVQKIAVQ